MNPKLNRSTLQSYLNDSVILTFVKNNLGALHGKVLDIGCGRMRYKNTVLQGKKVTEYIGLDLESGRFSYAVPADLYWDGIKMPLEDMSIDSALLLEVLEHCPDPQIVIDEASRILKHNGVLIISTPFLYPIHGSPYDYSRITPFLLKKMCENAGFREVRIESGGALDASLAQMISIWICYRPMPRIIREILKILYVPFFHLLLIIDREHTGSPMKDGIMITNVLGIAQK